MAALGYEGKKISEHAGHKPIELDKFDDWAYGSFAKAVSEIGLTNRKIAIANMAADYFDRTSKDERLWK